MVLLISREITITALRSIASAEGIIIAAGEGGKAKTALQAVALTLYLLPFLMVPGLAWVHVVAQVLMAVAFLLTVLTGANYVRSALRLRRGSVGA